MVRTTEPSPRKARSIRLMRSTALDGVGIFCVTVGEENDFYTLHEFPCEIGGRGFAVHKTGLGTLYHVRIGGPED